MLASPRHRQLLGHCSETLRFLSNIAFKNLVLDELELEVNRPEPGEKRRERRLRLGGGLISFGAFRRHIDRGLECWLTQCRAYRGGRVRGRQLAIGVGFSEYCPWEEVARCCYCGLVHMSMYSRLINRLSY